MANYRQDTLYVAFLALSASVWIFHAGALAQTQADLGSNQGTASPVVELAKTKNDVWNSLPRVPTVVEAALPLTASVLQPTSAEAIYPARNFDLSPEGESKISGLIETLLRPTSQEPWIKQFINSSENQVVTAQSLRPDPPQPPPKTTGQVEYATELPSDQIVQPLPASDARPKVIFQPAVPTRNATGQVILRPSVQIADPLTSEILPSNGYVSEVPNMPPSLWDSELNSILSRGDTDENVWQTSKADQRADGIWLGAWQSLSNFIRGRRSFDPRRGYDIGVGRERLPYALFEIDSTQPLNNYRLRFDSAYGWESPDRAEYFWAKGGGRGPAPAEPSVDYQDIRFMMETASPRFSLATEIPLRFINPTVAGNTTGLGDLALTTKTVLIDGDTWQLTQILRTQLSTGTAKLGRGNGHIAMEPGLLARYKWSEDTYLHSELKFWFPLGGDPTFSGQVLRYGFGVSNVMYDSDDFAVLRTLEFVSWSFVSGQKTVAIGPPVPVDGENILNLYPGLRWVHDSGGDFGMFEVGMSGGLSVTERHFYRELLRLDLRWSF